jgi:hypothetical protein
MKSLLPVSDGGQALAYSDVTGGGFGIQGILKQTGDQEVPILGSSALGSNADFTRLLTSTTLAINTVSQIESRFLGQAVYGVLLNLGVSISVMMSPMNQVSKYSTNGEALALEREIASSFPNS